MVSILVPAGYTDTCHASIYGELTVAHPFSTPKLSVQVFTSPYTVTKSPSFIVTKDLSGVNDTV